MLRLPQFGVELPTDVASVVALARQGLGRRMRALIMRLPLSR